jgi:hypothetical protein
MDDAGSLRTCEEAGSDTSHGFMLTVPLLMTVRIGAYAQAHCPWAPNQAPPTSKQDGRMTTTQQPGLRSVLAKPGYPALVRRPDHLAVGRHREHRRAGRTGVPPDRPGPGVSGAVIAEILPVLLLAPIAGAIVDRLPRARVMVAADLWRTALAGVLPLADHHLAAVYAIAFGLSADAVFFNPAAASVLPGIVDETELVAASQAGRG